MKKKIILLSSFLSIVFSFGITTEAAAKSVPYYLIKLGTLTCTGNPTICKSASPNRGELDTVVAQYNTITKVLTPK